MDPLDLFLPAVQQWFRTALGEPTPAQRQGWPAIAAGQHTLILAPTGSGKTLAAFLACLDQLWRRPAGVNPAARPDNSSVPGVRVLYISPLKALNNDIYRNLQVPLEGVAATARQLGQPLPAIDVAVRTGDTPAAERQRLVRRPPHVLITTPESLHLLLTSRARDTLRNLSHCIVDEIHSLCPNKRGVFLALLLERLAVLNPSGFVRIGLSATQRPLAEVARYLGGYEDCGLQNKDCRFRQRPVTIIDAGLRRELDLRVVSPVQQFGPLPEKSIWPSIYRLLQREIEQHRSTIVFANNRRTVERITANLNEVGSEDLGEPVPESAPHTSLARAHHGSVALEVRQATEQALKEGRLRAVVATASLELGIDMGAVDLVCQVESPGSVARGLQRVGRAGHVVGQKSKGRLIPKTSADLLEQAVLAREMAAGRVEELRCPRNCLDVLAQQVVALVSMDDWEVPALYALVRQAYPFHELSPQAFEAVLEMVTGRYRFRLQIADCRLQIESAETTACPAETSGADSAAIHNPHSAIPNPQSAISNLQSAISSPPLAALEPRISWDRVHNRLRALPGSQRLALVNGGTIPDTGQYAAYTTTGVRIGELDEEFIYERRIGDAFLLGTNAWRIERIEADRVRVAPAEGAPAMVPFWRGEMTSRSYDLGLALGRFLRDTAERIEQPGCLAWLQENCFLDPAAARNLRDYVRRQLDVAGSVPTDRTVTVEAARDPLGDWQVILLSPLGGKLHLGLRLALENRLRQRLGYRPQILQHNDGLLIRLADADEPVLDLFAGLEPENVEALILDELADSALFAMRFRQNAARALLLPRGRAGKRAPLWLQRLRGRDLLQVARQQADFPLVAETFRECLQDHLDVPRLQQLLGDIRAGRVEVKTRREAGPSPFASSLLFAFTAAFMYELDRTEPVERSAALDEQLLKQLVAPEEASHLLDPRAIHQVERRLRGLAQPPRSTTEMAERLRRLGDLSADELEGPMAGFLAELEADGLARRLQLSRCRQPQRWVLAEEEGRYRSAFGLGASREEGDPHAAAAGILYRFLATHALVGLQDILERYPFERAWAERQLEEWAQGGRAVAVAGPRADAAPAVIPSPQALWSVPANLEQVQRGTLALLRREVSACAPPQFADFVLRWQYLVPGRDAFASPEERLSAVLNRLQGLPVPADLWERIVLPSRVPGYQPRWLDDLCAGGDWAWVGSEADSGETESTEGRTPRSAARAPRFVSFWRREDFANLPPPVVAESLGPDADRVREHLRARGASFVVDIAQDTRLSPAVVRSALGSLLRRGLVTNDHFDALRRGEAWNAGPEAQSVAVGARRSLLRAPRPSRTGPRAAARSSRWSLVPWGHPEAEERAVFLASVLLERYGIVARELALVDAGLLPWRVLYEVLSRMELAGSVRRGYFVEGLSGAQFALPEAVELLQQGALPSTATAPVVLLHSLDPANVYGSGAPFDIPLLDGGTQPLLRRPGNWLVLRAGRPVLIVEQQGKKLTALPSASREDVAAAVARLPDILAADQGLSARPKLSVAQWNGQPVTASPGRELLEGAGFVRDYQEMTLYRAWR